MKKITSLLLCMVLVLSVFGMNAAAAGTACMEAGVTVAEDGTVTVAVAAVQSAANARLVVEFDPGCLTFVGCETPFAVHTVKAEEGRLTIGLANSSSEAVKAGDEVISLTFGTEGNAIGTEIVVAAERFGGKTVNESVALTVGTVEVLAEGWSGYTTWKLTSNGVLTVTPTEQQFNGQTNMKNYWKVGGVLTLPWSAYAEQITRVVIEDGVNDIGQMAFYEMPNLVEVVLPESLTEIRPYAFKNCKKLTAINLEVVDEAIREGAFYGCTALEKVALDEGVVIEDWAFSKVPGFDPAN